MNLEAVCLDCHSSSEYTIKPRPVKESIQEINDNSWLIGDRILLSREQFPSSNFTWSDGKGSFYAISDAPYPPPPSRPLSDTTNIRMVYDAGGVSAVWSIGEAFCKVKVLDSGATREHVTLHYLHNKRPLSFAIPDVYYHAEHDGRYYIILSSLAGQTVTEAWPKLDEAMRQHYVSQVVNSCKELAAWQADCISGVDGNYLPDAFLGMTKDFDPQTLLDSCRALEMDCSTFIFYHCDLGPGNIIVNHENRSIGIIDWETAGFVPKEWVRTKFCISGGMDLPGDDQESRVDWRRRVQRQLGVEGFFEIADRWMTRNED
ncbi:hypothetical protein V494_04480 [Pseudogymnoascus sp. VKM F-4513 (FW-928)]|nr:hypothetical protein V494_04480 [Pseudogymnoascus sp. VKM F-4513 (FW-928)]